MSASRASVLKANVDRYLERLRKGGALQEFNREYKRRRAAAQAQGLGFMSYTAALARLRSGVACEIINQSAAQPVFNAVFGEDVYLNRPL